MIRNMRIFAQVATASLAIAFTVGMFIASQLFIASRAAQNPVVRIQLLTVPR
jgi:hypothetical protein